MKQEHEKRIGPRREKWLEEYCTHGDSTLAAKNAGYKYHTDTDFRKEGNRLKKALESEITQEMEGRMGDKGPRALRVVEELMHASNSDTVRLAAAKDLLDRSGYKPVERIDVSTEQRSVEEIESRIIGLVGVEAAQTLLGKNKKEEDEEIIPLAEKPEEVSQTIN